MKAIARAAMPTVNVATVAQAAGLAPTLVAELATHGLGLESAAQVRVALGQDARLTTFAPRSVLVREALMVELTQEPVTTRELGEDLEVFTDKVLVRPDGDVVDALSGKSLGKAGELREQDGEWLAGELVVGALYGMRAGNVVALDDDDAATGDVLWEPGLAHSVADTLLDGIADGVIAQALGFAQTVTFPLRALEELSRLPFTVAALLVHSPQAWDEFRAMPAEAQLRRATDLATQALLIAGTFKVTSAGVDTLPPMSMPALVLQPSGVLAIEWVSVSAKGAAALGPATALILQTGWMRRGGRDFAGRDPNTPGVRGPSGHRSMQKYFKKRWEKSTFNTVEQSVEYHGNKHTRLMDPVEYTKRAAHFFEVSTGEREQVISKKGLRAVLITDDKLGKGLFTRTGRVIWFEEKK